MCRARLSLREYCELTRHRQCLEKFLFGLYACQLMSCEVRQYNMVIVVLICIEDAMNTVAPFPTCRPRWRMKLLEARQKKRLPSFSANLKAALDLFAH